MALVYTPETTSIIRRRDTTLEEFITILNGLHLSTDRIVIDLNARQVLENNVPVALCEQEFELLAYLAENADRAVSRAELLGTVWAGSGLDSQSRTIDAHVRRLRAKLGDADLISTIRGEGYRFNYIVGVHVISDATHSLAA